MAFFVWDNKYSVGVREIDNQHKILVDMLNELYEAMQSGKGNEILTGIILKLINYTKTHFATEERYFEKFSYPDTLSHKKEHEKFTEKVLAFKNDFNAGRVSLSVSITSFLKDWLVSHIQGIDKKYGPFFNSKGLS